jgi:hypothetical protein
MFFVFRRRIQIISKHAPGADETTILNNNPLWDKAMGSNPYIVANKYLPRYFNKRSNITIGANFNISINVYQIRMPDFCCRANLNTVTNHFYPPKLKGWGRHFLPNLPM